jgi:hypothetical protein
MVCCDIAMGFTCRQKDFPKRLPSYNNYGRLGILVTGKTIAVSSEDGPLCKCPLLQLLFPRIL